MNQNYSPWHRTGLRYTKQSIASTQNTWGYGDWNSLRTRLKSESAKAYLSKASDRLDFRLAMTKNRFASGTERIITNPNSLLRRLDIATRYIAGSTACSLIAGPFLPNPIWSRAALGFATGTAGLYFGYAKSTYSYIKDREYNVLIKKCSSNAKLANGYFLSETLQYGSSRRAIAGAELLARAEWRSNVPLALDIANSTMFGLANLPKRHQKRVANHIMKLSDTLDIHHPYAGIIRSMGIEVAAMSRLGNR